MTRTALAAITAVAALMMASTLIPVRVQAAPEASRIELQRPWQKSIRLIDYNRDDVRDVLRELFGNAGFSYSIDPKVQGTVSLSLQNVTFETALENVLRQVDAGYRLDKSVIHVYRLPGGSPRTVSPVVRGPELVPPTVDGASAASGDTVVVHDSNYLYVLRGTKMFKLRKTDLRVIAAGAVPR